MNSVHKTHTRSFAVLLAVCFTLASMAHAAEPIVLTNGVAVTGISGSAGNEKFYSIEVPSGQDELEIAISGGTGDVDMYVRLNSPPTTTSYDYRPYKVGNNETVTVENPTAGTWHIMLRGYNNYSGVTLLATYSGAMAVTPLKNGVPITNIAGADNTEQYFSIDVPAGQTKLEISMSGGTGDADLYVKKGAMPTTTSYDYRPFLFGNDETVSVNNPQATTWYIMIRGYNAFTGITLLASYGGGGTGTLLKDGVPITDIAGAQGSEKIYRVELPAGQTSLQIAMSGGTGDADLYVKYGAPPTQTDYDYRPFLAGSDETVTINNPTGGTWYIMIRGYSNYSDLTLLATYGSVFALQDAVPVTNLSGALGSERHFKIEVPAGQDSLLIVLSGGTGDADMYIKRGSKASTTDYDYRPTGTVGNNESISFGSGGNLAGTWYILIKATKAYEGASLKADYSASSNVTLLMNGVPVTGIAGAAAVERHFMIQVPSGVQKLEIVMSGGTGDADMYVRKGAQPTTSQYDYRPYLIGNDESVTVNNPSPGGWYIMIRGYQAFSGVQLVATYGGGTPPDEVTTLQNGVPVTGIAGGTGSEKFYKITVPAGQAELEIAMSGGTGDVDLYVRKGSKPTTSEWDYRPYLIGNNETVTIDSPAPATYYIMLRGYTAHTGVSLVATYFPVPEQITTLANCVPETGLSGASGSEKFFKIDVPFGQDMLKIAISGGTGDVDMYVKKGSKPSATSWDYRPYLIGNNESVEVTNPAPATWYIMLRGYQAYTGVSLEACYSAVAEGNNFASDPNAVAAWRFEPGKLRVDSVGPHTLTNYGAVVETVDFKEGRGSADFELDQTDYLRISNASLSSKFPFKDLSAPTTITVAFWINIESLPTGGDTYNPFSKWSWPDGRCFNATIGDGGQVGLLIGTDNGTSYEEKWTIGSIVPGEWYHVVISYRDSDKSYRINVWDTQFDTVMADQKGHTKKNISITATDVCLGTRADLPETHKFDGLLDEMVVFNDLLTDAEIAKIREGTFGKP